MNEKKNTLSFKKAWPKVSLFEKKLTMAWQFGNVDRQIFGSKFVKYSVQITLKYPGQTIQVDRKNQNTQEYNRNTHYLKKDRIELLSPKHARIR